MKVASFLFVLTFCFLLNDVYAQSNSRIIPESFKKELKQLREKKPRQIKKIETSDSTIIYGADKNRTHLLLVSSHNVVTSMHIQFQYNERGVFLITVLKRSRIADQFGLKRKRSSYYFDNGKLIGTIGDDCTDDVSFLYAEANRHWRLGVEFL